MKLQFCILTLFGIFAASGVRANDIASEAKEEYADVNGIRMFYRVYGQGPPLLLLHGFGDNGEVGWGPSVDRLSKHYQLIVPDLRGHGRSTNPSGEFTHEQAAEDVIALLDHLGINSSKAVGHSTGAMTLLHVAMKQSERLSAMALHGAVYSFDDAMKKSIAQAADMFEKSEVGIKEAASRHVGGEAQARTLIQNFRRFSVDTGMRLELNALRSIKARVLVILGDRDGLIPVEKGVEMYRAIPKAQLMILPNMGHDWGAGRAAPFLPDLIKFLNADE